MDMVPVTITAKKKSPGVAGALNYSGNIVVKTPDFTFRGAEAIVKDNWYFLKGKWDVERKAEKYLVTDMFIRRRAGGSIEYSFRSFTDTEGKAGNYYDKILNEINKETGK